MTAFTVTEGECPQHELARLDDQLMALIAERTEVARRITAHRVRCGGTRFVYDEELATVRRFGVLGPVGAQLALLLLRSARELAASEFVHADS